eukprot:1568175-Pyramimonas_sp.AAC.1
MDVRAMASVGGPRGARQGGGQRRFETSARISECLGLCRCVPPPRAASFLLPFVSPPSPLTA